jgi:formate-dependent phosphoribosylglycinamide formyltransferase (GAR transformylase)
MAKVLLVDTNFSSRPIFEELERLGHEVHVVGSNPSDCLAKACAHYWHLNYGDTEALHALVDKEQFTYLVPGCTDRSYSSCAVVSQGRFPGIASANVDEALNHKDRFRSLALSLDLPVPRVQWQDGVDSGSTSLPTDSQLHWPMVVKPVDGFSGKGVTILLKAGGIALHQAISAARAASARGLCLIEDYVQGQLHSHSAFLQAGQVAQDVIVVEHCTANPYVVDTSRMLPMVSAGLRDKLRHAIETLANALNLEDGLVHTQFILDGEQPWLIEITRRCPGDLYSQLIELSGGIGYVGNYVRPFLGLPAVMQAPQPYVPVMRHTITVKVAQGFDHLHFRQPMILERWVPLSLTGDRLQPSPAGRIGILFARTEDEKQLDGLYNTTLARQLYDVVP